MREMLAVGLILDPRYKMRYLRYSLEQSLDAAGVDLFIAKVRTTLLAMWQLFIPTETLPDSTPQIDSSSKTNDPDLLAFHQHMAGTMGGSKINAPGAELDLYLGERNVIVTGEKNEQFNIGSWWKNNATRYPSLSEFARIMLMVPVTSVASESAFSTGG
ncbi:hypothetical protein PGTUg99_050182 [Puccinia graminis f. sp. tritici]|uniref:HAT C-terminal dimerisation domain-containing protein n=1 Tax=Puccinia graminis f. sp. tritici TaxID=56615 RepID=A0A5B0RUX9_PUCGR|nr:hypothetical protein PGTUg99_050182 [Puccinia graminis f. sp. tritici]